MYSYKGCWVEVVDNIFYKEDMSEFAYDRFSVGVYFNGTCIYDDTSPKREDAERLGEEYIDRHGYEWCIQ